MLCLYHFSNRIGLSIWFRHQDWWFLWRNPTGFRLTRSDVVFSCCQHWLLLGHGLDSSNFLLLNGVPLHVEGNKFLSVYLSSFILQSSEEVMTRCHQWLSCHQSRWIYEVFQVTSIHFCWKLRVLFAFEIELACWIFGIKSSRETINNWSTISKWRVNRNSVPELMSYRFH